MKFEKIKIAVAYALLLYFLCVVVPPVSSILPSAASLADSTDIAVIGKDTARERMYLYDLTLWEILKRAKRSDSVIAAHPQESGDHRQHIADQLIDISENGPGMCPLPTVRFCDARNQKIKQITGYPFATSGLSPPSLV